MENLFPKMFLRGKPEDLPLNLTKFSLTKWHWSNDLLFFVPHAEESLEPKVQGLLGINASSVDSTGKRFTGPFSESVSPHLPQFNVELVYHIWLEVDVFSNCDNCGNMNTWEENLKIARYVDKNFRYIFSHMNWGIGYGAKRST